MIVAVPYPPSPFRRCAPPSLSQWEREGARPAQPGGKGEGGCVALSIAHL